MSSPLLYLKQNIDRINFDCEDKYKAEYRRVFSNVLGRLDRYFVNNGIYEIVDYKPIVELIFSLKLGIDKDFLTKIGAAGIFTHGKGIDINAEYFNKGTTTEGVLCHEFIHFLTLAPDKIAYTKNGEKFENIFPTIGQNKNRYRRNISKNQFETLENMNALSHGFICEALTELFKQEIYSSNECYHSYIPQTSLINLLNNLTGEKVNFKDFLCGYLPNYEEQLGRENFAKFIELCKNFQNKFISNYNIDYLQDDDYIQAQDLICKTILQNIIQNPQKYSIDQYVQICSSILTDAPVVAKSYKDLISQAGMAATKNQNLSEQQKEKFNKLLQKTVDTAVDDKTNIFQVANSNLKFSFKKFDEGFGVRFANNDFFLNNRFPQRAGLKTGFVDGEYSIWVEMTEKGSYEITASKGKTKVQSIKLIQDSKDADRIMIIDENKQVHALNFEKLKNRNKKNLKNDLSLLNNFNHYEMLQQIVDENPNVSINSINKIKDKNGNEYFVAYAANKAAFYQIIGNRTKKINVTKKSKVNLNSDIVSKVKVGHGETQAFGFHEEAKTDEDSLCFELENGQTFVNYYTQDGVKYAEKTDSSFAAKQIVYEKIENTSLYDSINKDTKDVFEVDDGQRIDKMPLVDFKAEEIAYFNLKAKRMRDAYAQQQERIKKLQEKRVREKIAKQQQEEREKEIERIRQAKEKQQQEQEQKFEEIKKKAKEKDISITEDFKNSKTEQSAIEEMEQSMEM